jgi:transcriptional regulator with XRE-family HTH domain
MTIRDVAKHVGVSWTTISLWELGKRRPSAANVPALARALSLTIPNLVSLLPAGVHHAPAKTPPPNALAILRGRAGMTQPQAAKRLRVSVRTLSRWERGDRPIRLGEARRIALTYRCGLARVAVATNLTIHPKSVPHLWRSEDLPGALALLREASDLSRTKLSAFLGVKPGTVAQWESGTTTPTGQVLRRLEELYRLGNRELQRLVPQTRNTSPSQAGAPLTRRRYTAALPTPTAMVNRP